MAEKTYRSEAITKIKGIRAAKDLKKKLGGGGMVQSMAPMSVHRSSYDAFDYKITVFHKAFEDVVRNHLNQPTLEFREIN